MIDYLRQLYQETMSHPEVWLKPAIFICAIFIVGGLTWWIFNAVMGHVRRRLENRPTFEKNLQLFNLLKKTGHYGIVILVGAWLLDFFQAEVVERIFFALMIVLIASIVNSVLKTFLPILKQSIAAKTKTGVDDVLIELAMNFSSVIIYAVAVILALDTLGLNITPFLAGASVAGIAIGFAAKDTLSNLIAGVLLIIDRPFEMGDRIEVWTAPKNSATWGDVVDIGIRATKIRTTDNIVVVIPNNEIMKRDIINYTTMTSEIRVRIPIGIAYDADIGMAKNIIAAVSLELDWVMKAPPPKIVVRTFGESSVNLEARVWISNPRRRMDTISHITDRVKTEFDAAGIEIPYPKRDITIKNADAGSN